MLHTLSPDGCLLFCARMIRMFAYGCLSVVLALYLAYLGLTEAEIGLLLTLALLGDAAISLWMTTHADWIGRRRILLVGAGLMVFAGTLFAMSENFALLVVAATIGVISPTGSEVGPFLAIEQAALSQLLPAEQRTRVFAWYNLVAGFATAFGALGGGMLVQALQGAGLSAPASYRAVILSYAAAGLVLGGLSRRLSVAVETPTPAKSLVVPSPSRLYLGLHRSRGVVVKLALLFILDAFAGSFVVQSLLAYWFHIRFGVDPAALGGIFFGANLLAGVSALSAASIAARIGLINTMVFTHLPSNLLLVLVPLMPSLPLAVTILLLRFSLSQMDVPTRQSYLMAVVASDERSSAAGITALARTIGAALAPMFTGMLLATPTLMDMPFFISGGLKIVYDMLLYFGFRALKPEPESKV